MGTKYSYNVLVVDDDEDIREIITEFLAPEAKSIYQAGDGVEALEVIKKKRVDIIFSDVRMPNMSGIELLKKLREDGSDVVFILVTGHSDKDVATCALQWGAYDIIEKPFKAHELISTFQRAIIKCAYEEENQRLVDEFITSKLGEKSSDEIDPAELEKLRAISQSILEFKRIKHRRKG